MRANTTQKAYDEAFLACSTAVYFESQHNEKEALRSWKIALDHIYYHNARRNPTTYRPSSETERALLESLRQLELQCKERVDLLEALKKSREESKESLSSTDAQAPTPPPYGVTLARTDTNASSEWPGGRSIPPVVQSDLARPPPLPTRPSMASRKSSGNTSKRINSLTQTMSNSTLTPGPSEDKTSRTPSPEKKGSRMLRTLRPSREGKPASKMPASMRSRPDASKAATLAFGARTAAATSSRPGLTVPKVSTPPVHISPRSSMEMPAATPQPETPLVQSTSQDPPKPAPFYFQTREGAGSTNYAVPAPKNSSDAEKPKSPPIPRKAAPPPPPIPQKPAELGRTPSSQTSPAMPPLPAFPSYRKEYPPAQLDPRLLAASAAARSYSDLGSSRYGNKEIDNTRRPSGAPPTPSNISRTRNVRRQDSPEPIPLAEDGFDDEPQRPPRRTARKRGDSMRAELPPNPTAESGEGGDTNEEPDEWKRKTEEILKNLPRGVDKQSAQNILNEIVIQGDEVHWDDVAGLEIAKSALKETVVYPFLRPDLFMGLREPARGMLLFGPPGTGKTMLARAVATESKSTFFAISASSLTSKFLGESEKLVRALFALAKLLAPSIIFVDEIDSLLSSRGGSSEHEATRRIKTEFLIQWSDLQKAAAGRETTEKDKERGDATRVLVLAATNLPWAIDEAARRRFVRRQYIPLPEDFVRKQQVKTLLSHQKHEMSERDLDRLVALTDGFSGSDITALAKDAAMGPLRSLGESLLTMTMDQIRPMRFEDFQASLRTIRPSVSKQGLKEFEDWSREFGERGG
ncbi:uncharacterized protein EKO05_0009431 [Ascochyta rabiei]|uniref:ATP binding n=1 Tax=Didymella rabiei TaxID=5454 RepID=A0A163KX83_DIDRA|nr:uncharacterized protein EKO05_0009431 [Ascochyta rabiei]KZM27323.1 ATP binding [Ascochyta rabiei]UPX19160.1 hypothetical protein EKO05_0009431 [Ascochyta rabiei]